MALKIIRSDIFEVKADCIINPTDKYLTGSGSIDARIHKASNKELSNYLMKKDVLIFDAGDVVCTPGFGLTYKYVLHTVGPIYNGLKSDWLVLKSCFQNALILAYKLKCKSIALPLIGTGAFCFEKDRVIQIALDVINSFLLAYDMDVYLVIYSKDIFALSYEIPNIEYLLSDKFEEELKNKAKNIRLFSYNENLLLSRPKGKIYFENHIIEACDLKNVELNLNQDKKSIKSIPKNLKIDEAIFKEEYKKIKKVKELSFADKLNALIEDFGFSPSSVYNAAQINKKTYHSMIDKKSNPTYENALKYAIVLPLSLSEVDELLASAGYALNPNKNKEAVIRKVIALKEASGFKDLFNLVQLNDILYDLNLETF